jgi:hypothetical protein
MPVHQDGTRPAHSDAAAELGARQMEEVAQYPQQWNVRRGCDYVRFAVDLKRNARHIYPRRFLPIPGSEPRHVDAQLRATTDDVEYQHVNLAQKNVNGILLVFPGGCGKSIAIADEERKNGMPLSRSATAWKGPRSPVLQKDPLPYVAFSGRLPISSVEGKEGKSNDDTTSKCR